MGERMLQRKKWFFAALAAALATFFYLRGDKVTYAISAVTVYFAAFSAEQWTVIGVIAGIVMGVATFVLTWVYKQKMLEAVRRDGAKALFEEGL